MPANKPKGGAALPIGADEFAAALAQLGVLPEKPQIAVATSGGADSMALCLLLQEFVQQRGGKITALTVDHGLRAESAEEAAQVARWLKRRQIAHVVLRWKHRENIVQNIQAQARDARYGLMREWCQTHGVLWLCTAHHQDDQAETFLLRLSRGSGLEGLSAIPARRRDDGIILLRPLLGFSKERLIATLHAHTQEWIEDPSNESNAYQRNRLRQWLKARPDDLLPASRIADAASALARARAALEHQLAGILTRHVQVFPQGYAAFDPALLRDLPRELGLRALERMLSTVGGHALPPRLDSLERLYDYLRCGTWNTGFTLAGCYGMPPANRRNSALLMREPAACEPALAPAPDRPVRWDNRWQVELTGRVAKKTLENLRVHALGMKEAQTLRAALPRAHALRGLPVMLMASLPCLRHLDECVAAPHMEFSALQSDSPVFRAAFMPLKPLAAEAFWGME